MNLEIEVEHLTLAHKAVRAELLAERATAGNWVGHLSSSPFATAAAVSALVAAHHRDSEVALRDSGAADSQVIEQVVQGDLSELLVESVNWLAKHQNADGGWGDCIGARSNIAATMMVQAAFRLTGIPAKFADLMVRADDYAAAQSGVAGLRRQCDGDKPLLAAILANCAIADMLSWRQVPTLPFELTCLTKRWRRDLQLFAARQAMPVVLAVGRAKFHHDPPKNPISRFLRRSVRSKALLILERLQAADDSFLASVPITAFVVMSLSSMGCQDHPIVRRGIEFLLSSVRADSSWSVTPNLAVSNTALALSSLTEPPAATQGEWISHDHEHAESAACDERSIDWLLANQRREPNAVTDVLEGGWAMSDSIGSLPNTIATAQVLSAIAKLHDHSSALQRERIGRAVGRGVAWLLNLQNDDGGWPTHYHDETLLRFDHSGADATAQVLLALAAWRREWEGANGADVARQPIAIDERIARAIGAGWKYLESQQRHDGSFVPVWFGNERQPEERSPVYGTAVVLSACAELDRLDSNLAQRAAQWLMAAQHTSGGWGPPRTPVDYSGVDSSGSLSRRANEAMAQFCSVEETALAVGALLALAQSNTAISQAVSRGLMWLTHAVEQDSHRRPAIIGFSLSKLWYDERLYPLAFATGALSRAVHSAAPATPAASHVS